MNMAKVFRSRGVYPITRILQICVSFLIGWRYFGGTLMPRWVMSDTANQFYNVQIAINHGRQTFTTCLYVACGQGLAGRIGSKGQRLLPQVTRQKFIKCWEQHSKKTIKYYFKKTTTSFSTVFHLSVKKYTNIFKRNGQTKYTCGLIDFIWE